MSKMGDLIRQIWVPKAERDASLGSLLGDRSRYSSSSSAAMSIDSALKNSVWWAGLRLRANIMSTLPVDVVRAGADGVLSKVQNPGSMFVTPYPGQDISEFLYDVQIDLDSYGNAVGIPLERNALGFPAVVELVNKANIVASMNGGRVVQWRLNGKYYSPKDVWHQRQYTMSGCDLGLSALANAARYLNIYASAQDYAADWFAYGATPRGVLKNTVRDKIPTEVRRDAKDQFREATAGGDIFVTGTEWEWTPAATDAASSGFLDQQTASAQDICRYIDVPADMIDIGTATGNITYANITQRNLQFLITALGPSLVRTERYWSTKAMPEQWQLKINSDALLRMDPVTRNDLILKQVAGKTMTTTEARRLDNRAPLTAEQLAEMGTMAALGKVQIVTGDGAADNVARALQLATVAQKLYLAVGTVLTEDEAREIMNEAGADLPALTGTLSGVAAP